jgi:hypothetical protein
MSDEDIRDDILRLDVKHPSGFWQKLTGVHILDFDGWPEQGSWLIPLTLHEFMERVRNCTVDGDTIRIINAYFHLDDPEAGSYRVSTREEMPVLAAPKWLKDRMEKLRALPPPTRDKVAAQFAASALARKLDESA